VSMNPGSPPPAGQPPPGQPPPDRPPLSGRPPPGIVLLDTTAGTSQTPQVETVPTGDVVLTLEQQKRADFVRAWITFWLLGLLTLVLLLAGIAAFVPGSLVDAKTATVLWTQAKEYLNIALPGVAGLLGTVIGFYFGSRAAQQGHSS
jgi:hypothetical protein